jgi:hypothetical protein
LLEGLSAINKVIKQSLAPGLLHELKHHTIHHSKHDKNASNYSAQVYQELAELVVLTSDLHGEGREFKSHLDVLAADFRILLLVLGQGVRPGLVVTLVAGLGCVHEYVGHEFKELEIVVVLLVRFFFHLTDDVFVKRLLG